VEYNQKSTALNLHTAAGSSSCTPAAAHGLNLQPGKDQPAADAAKLKLQPDQEQADAEAQQNLQPGKDQPAADAANLNLQPDQEEVASVSMWNAV
jgi:membrane protease subunit (stomatin/prohibitin family)